MKFPQNFSARLFTTLSRQQRQKGFTLIEMLVVVAIVIVIATMVALPFSNFRQAQALSNSVDEVTALLNEARTRTQEGDGGLQYGVHLQSTQAVLFSGTSYVANASGNIPYVLDTSVTITSISLAGAGADVIFTPLSGATSDYGTLIIRRTSTTAGQKTLTITAPGLVSSN